MDELIKYLIEKQKDKNKSTTVGKPVPNWLCKGKTSPRIWVTKQTLKHIKK